MYKRQLYECPAVGVWVAVELGQRAFDRVGHASRRAERAHIRRKVERNAAVDISAVAVFRLIKHSLPSQRKNQQPDHTPFKGIAGSWKIEGIYVRCMFAGNQRNAAIA